MTPKEKKEILSKYIELLVMNGYDIKFILGKPLNNWNYNGIKIRIEQLEKEFKLNNYNE